MAIKSMNDIFKLLSNYGATEQQFFFVVDLLSMHFKKWNINNFVEFKDYILLKQNDNVGFVITLQKGYFDIILVDNSNGISLYYGDRKLNVTICNMLKKELYFCEILPCGTSVSYYDKARYEQAKKQDEDLYLRLKPFKNISPKNVCYLDSGETYASLLQKLQLMKDSTIQISLFYYDEENKLKVL